MVQDLGTGKKTLDFTLSFCWALSNHSSTLRQDKKGCGRSGSYKVRTGPRLGETSPRRRSGQSAWRGAQVTTHILTAGPGSEAWLTICRCILLTNFGISTSPQNFKQQHLLFIKTYPLVLQEHTMLNERRSAPFTVGFYVSGSNCVSSTCASFGALWLKRSRLTGLHLAEAFLSIGPNLNSLSAHADLHDSIADEGFL